jgi:membrane associated rhomboid family serine protease
MTLFILIAAIYSAILLLAKPMPESLHAVPLSRRAHFHSIKAAFLTGFLILIVFLFTSRFTFIKTDDFLFKVLAFNNVSTMPNLAFFQLFTHSFVHIDIIHLLTNLIGIGLASIYERRVGSKRFLAVLLVSCAASTASIVFYKHDVFVVGLSGGIFGLAAAYFTDNETLTTKEWLKAIGMFIFLFVVFSLQNISKAKGLPFGIDYTGHALGALGAIVYCRFVKRRVQVKL